VGLTYAGFESHTVVLAVYWLNILPLKMQLKGERIQLDGGRCYRGAKAGMECLARSGG
jgi:hypothetical protein